MWLYVISANVVILSFALSVFFGVPLTVPLILTVVVGLALAARALIGYLRAKKGASGIEKALGMQADAFAKNVRPDQSAEQEEMRQQFMKELGALKKSKLGGGGTAALYSLPWYMIIGPPGAGKSTALKNSGLNFPSKKGAIRGIGGTRNCDWWLSNEAVLLDTAGRYATEDEDRDEWLSFLDIIKKNRSKKSLNGLIVAVSVTDLGGHSEEEVTELAKTIRARIDEVTARLKMVFPVYVLFTKCDLLPGFIETFGALKKGDRAQIWGATFPIDKEGQKAGELFHERYQELHGVLQDRMFMRCEEERRPEMREKIYQFPQQVRVIAPQVEQFIEMVFSEDAYADAPLLRGVYLSSGTQEGRPVDLLTSSMMEAFGVNAQSEQAAPETTAKSYFLGDLFTKVMFPDQGVAVRNSRGKALVLMQRTGVMGGALLTAALLTLLPYTSYRQNAAIVDSTKTIINGVVAERERNKDRVVPPASLEALRDRLKELKDWEADAPPLAMRYGMFQGSVLFPFVQRFYIKVLQKELLEPMLNGDVEEMKTLPTVYGANSRPSDEDYKRFFDKLKLHLLLTPHGAGEPDIEEDVEKWVVRQLVDRWTAGLDKAPDVVGENQMEKHIRFYLQLLRENPDIALKRDVQAVKDTRNMLNRVSYAEAVIKQIIAETATQDRDQNLRRIMAGAVTPLVADHNAHVRAAFTKWAWDSVVKERLEREGDQSDRWVFGPGASGGGDRAAFVAQLRSTYFVAYIDEWRDFINAVRISQPPDVQNALVMLRDLTKGEPPPLKRLFIAIAENTQLKDKASAGASAAGSGAVTKMAGGLLNKLKKTFGAKAAEAAVAQGKNAVNQQLSGPLDAGAVDEAFRDLVRFGVAAPPDAGAGGDKPPPPKTTSLDLFTEQLGVVYDATKSYVEDPKDAGALLGKISAARAAMAKELNQAEIGPRWRSRLESLVWAPFDDLADSLVVLKADTSRKWCGAVVSPYVRSLKKRFPFENSKEEATIADVVAFLAPKAGALWAFYASDLASDVLQMGSKFKIDGRMGGMLTKAYDPTLVPYLEGAVSVTNTLFPPGSAAPKLDLDVRIQASAGFSSITLEIGGGSIDYRGGPERFKRIAWPGSEPASGATLRVVGRSGAEETIQRGGEWGLFRLLEAGTVVSSKNGVITVKWSARQLKESVTLEFKIAGGRSGWLESRARKGAAMNLAVGNLTPPFTIAKGSPACNP